jgi:hypothetical protein
VAPISETNFNTTLYFPLSLIKNYIITWGYADSSPASLFLVAFVLSKAETCAAKDSGGNRDSPISHGKKTTWETKNVTPRNYFPANVTNIVMQIR